MRLFGAYLPENTDADNFGSCLLDVLVPSHTPSQMDRELFLQLIVGPLQPRKRQEQWAFRDPAAT